MPARLTGSAAGRRAALFLLLSVVSTACSVAPAVESPPSIRPSASVAPPSDGASPSASPSPPSIEPLTGAAIAASIDADDLREHLVALQEIADDPALADATRATGSIGFERSVDHVRDVLAAAGYAVERQDLAVGAVPSSNLLAERGTGDGVLIVGAHLDSVLAGPGINDNGSGVAALLVVAEALQALPPPHATVRLAFWGAEEGGPFGSRAYVDGLDPDERARIRGYLNLDMLGSPNAVTFVYDEPNAAAGSAAFTTALAAYFDERDLPWEPIDLEGDSDHGPFIDAGIPTGGLFSGGIEPVTADQAIRHGALAGQPADPCSHRACDTLDNVDLDQVALMTDAIAHVLGALAAEGR